MKVTITNVILELDSYKYRVFCILDTCISPQKKRKLITKVKKYFLVMSKLFSALIQINLVTISYKKMNGCVMLLNNIRRMIRRKSVLKNNNE
jgi:hypothetical protein